MDEDDGADDDDDDETSSDDSSSQEGQHFDDDDNDNDDDYSESEDRSSNSEGTGDWDGSPEDVYWPSTVWKKRNNQQDGRNRHGDRNSNHDDDNDDDEDDDDNLGDHLPMIPKVDHMSLEHALMELEDDVGSKLGMPTSVMVDQDDDDVSTLYTLQPLHQHSTNVRDTSTNNGLSPFSLTQSPLRNTNNNNNNNNEQGLLFRSLSPAISQDSPTQLKIGKGLLFGNVFKRSSGNNDNDNNGTAARPSSGANSIGSSAGDGANSILNQPTTTTRQRQDQQQIQDPQQQQQPTSAPQLLSMKQAAVVDPLEKSGDGPEWNEEARQFIMRSRAHQRRQKRQISGSNHSSMDSLDNSKSHHSRGGRPPLLQQNSNSRHQRQRNNGNRNPSQKRQRPQLRSLGSFFSRSADGSSSQSLSAAVEQKRALDDKSHFSLQANTIVDVEAMTMGGAEELVREASSSEEDEFSDDDDDDDGWEDEDEDDDDEIEELDYDDGEDDNDTYTENDDDDYLGVSLHRTQGGLGMSGRSGPLLDVAEDGEEEDEDSDVRPPDHRTRHFNSNGVVDHDKDHHDKDSDHDDDDDDGEESLSLADALQSPPQKHKKENNQYLSLEEEYTRLKFQQIELVALQDQRKL